MQLLGEEAKQQVLIGLALHGISIPSLLILKPRRRAGGFQKCGVEVMNGVNHDKHCFLKPAKAHVEVGNLIRGGYPAQGRVKIVSSHELCSCGWNRGAKAESGAGVIPPPAKGSAA